MGRANIREVLDEAANRRKRGERDPIVELAAQHLKVHFEEVRNGLGPDACRLAYRQEIEGELLSEAEAEELERAEVKPIRTTIDQETAAALADLIRERTANWAG